MTSGESQLHFCNPPRKSSGCTCISGCKNHMKVGASHDQMDACILLWSFQVKCFSSRAYTSHRHVPERLATMFDQ
ncbi:hypothetical protein L208DRAFT_331947 [Tricholoma matsutake]|nr:hypothetical protein L208DRAFT_331947 [Tricholoma matsutake 945]